ncbi:MAG: hypothetical protein VX730_08320 [Pseudomonadota bacterium]|nr:hypothetical protein [Pseudomonadota bacterium]
MSIFSRSSASSALRGTLMALPVMAGLSAGQAMAHAPETSLRPEPRPSDLMEKHDIAQEQATQDALAAIRPQMRPPTLGASEAFMSIYDAEGTATLQANMDATLGGTNHALVVNFDKFDNKLLSTEELYRLSYELDNYASAKMNGRTSFTDYHRDRNAFMPEVHDTPEGRLKVIEGLKENWEKSYLHPRANDSNERVAIAGYGNLSTADELANFSTPVTYFTDEQLQKENAMFDDYVKRHEMCHGFDPSIYEGLPDKYANANFDLVAPTGEVTSLRDSYKTYFKEQFADGCATLEYALEEDYESLEMMADISQFRDSASLNNTSIDFQIAKTDAIKEQVASDTKVTSRMEKYFLGHDTGPTIRQISVLSERLQPTDKAILAADPQAFEQFVKEVIENSAYSPEEYMQIAHDSLAMSQNVDAPISDVTREFLGRGYDGRTHTIEYNLQLPEGSIRALQDAAPTAVQDQAREAVLLYADNMDNPTKINMLNFPTEELSNMPLEDRLLFGSSYDLISGTDTWKGLHQLSPELKDMGTREVTPHMASFHFRNAGLVAQEAGDKLYEIADPEFDKDLYEMEQEALKGFEIKF